MAHRINAVTRQMTLQLIRSDRQVCVCMLIEKEGEKARQNVINKYTVNCVLHGFQYNLY